MKIKFVVPGTVRGKQRPKFARMGNFVKTYTPQQTVDYENWIKQCFITKYPNFKPLESPLMLTLKAYYIKAKSNKMIYPMLKPDIDNVIKCMDSLNGIAFKDDKQIVGVCANKFWGDIERIEIELEEIAL